MGSAKRKPKVATGQTINPTAWQTAALGVEGSAALKRRQQRPMTGPENGAGTLGVAGVGGGAAREPSMAWSSARTAQNVRTERSAEIKKQ